jgi:hypothetical protein
VEQDERRTNGTTLGGESMDNTTFLVELYIGTLIGGLTTLVFGVWFNVFGVTQIKFLLLIGVVYTVATLILFIHEFKKEEDEPGDEK